MTLSILLFGFADPGFIIAALAILLLFGGKKIPELMKGLGKGINEFKKGKDGAEDELENKDK
jgi:sec-independent protein translocase protein TatA